MALDRAQLHRATIPLAGFLFLAAGLDACLYRSGLITAGAEAVFLAAFAALAGVLWALLIFALSNRDALMHKPVAEPVVEARDSRLDSTLPLIFHEIKNYAYTMKGNTTMLRSQLPEGETHVSLERLERATERIEKLSREVMDLSLMGRPSDSRRLDLGSLLRTAAEGYFQGLGLTFTFKSDQLAFPVNGEERKLEQVFLNLFKNALEAGAGRIDVSMLAHPGKVGILIEDDGKGCSPEQVEKMFDAYQSFRRGGGGSGLGLFLVKAIVEGHGGSISGFSKNEKGRDTSGMVFVLQFPLA